MLRGAVVVVRNDDGSILLLKRAPESRFAPEKWGFPGGKIEEGETPLQAAVRETKEETSLDVLDIKDLGRFDLVQAFLAGAYEGEVDIDHEHSEWAWVPDADLSQYDLAPNVVEICRGASKHG